VIVAVLAGGRGRRMGSPKPLAMLGGTPLIERPLAAAREAGLEAVVVAKAGTPLPEGVTVWREPDEPFHPLLGVITALERAAGPVVAVACDQPFVPAALLARLAGGAAAAAVEVDGRLEPFPARYEPAWLPALRTALEREAPMRETLAALGPATMTWEAAALRSIDTPEQLAAADEIVGAAGDDEIVGA
jgi:molybdopterin-guanine dinucleotide biosynthesis protein A